MQSFEADAEKVCSSRLVAVGSLQYLENEFSFHLFYRGAKWKSYFG